MADITAVRAWPLGPAESVRILRGWLGCRPPREDEASEKVLDTALPAAEDTTEPGAETLSVGEAEREIECAAEALEPKSDPASLPRRSCSGTRGTGGTPACCRDEV
jgi:hypothetical protein